MSETETIERVEYRQPRWLYGLFAFALLAQLPVHAQDDGIWSWVWTIFALLGGLNAVAMIFRQRVVVDRQGVESREAWTRRCSWSQVRKVVVTSHISGQARFEIEGRRFDVRLFGKWVVDGDRRDPREALPHVLTLARNAGVEVDDSVHY